MHWSQRPEPLQRETSHGISAAMILQKTKGPEARSDTRRAAWQVLLVLVPLPVLGIAAGLGGMAAWFHSHGPSGAHLHLVASHTDRCERDVFHDVLAYNGHEAHHRHGQTGESHERDDSAPTGLRFELPEILAAPPRGPTVASATIIPPAAPRPPSPWRLALIEIEHQPDLCRAGWPPQWAPRRAPRSGVLQVLDSSHAILI